MRFKSLRRPLIGLLLVCLMAGLLGPAFALYPLVPLFENFQRQHHPSDWSIVDRHGRMLQETRVNKSVRRLDWVSIKDIAPSLIEAIVRAEDKRFFYHFGVDAIAGLNSFKQYFIDNNRRGASTITMQVASMVDEKFGGRKSRAGSRGIWEKLRQVYISTLLETKWSKDQILEAYLNSVYFRGELQGLMAASLGLFGKWPHGLLAEESAVLAALIRAPNTTAKVVGNRACVLGQALWDWTQENCEKATEIAVTHLASGALPERTTLAPHVARMVIQKLTREKKSTQSIVRTTLDAELQRFARNALYRQISILRSQNMNDGAVVVLDNATGDVLAYVGNVGQLSKAVYVDGARALRQAGSTLKPFLFGRAFERRFLTPATLLHDTPYSVSVENGVYRPQNYDKAFKQLVPVRTALGSSLNIPAVRALEMITVDDLVGTLKNFGVTALERPDFYGPSLALGSADVRLTELTNAYRTLANNGKFSEIRFLPDDPISEPKEVMSPQAAHLVQNILSDRESRSLTFGFENVLSTAYWSGVKTGTSKDMRDNWCIGFSRRFTVGVWTGNFGGDSMWNVSGVHGAAPVWFEVMNYLHQNIPSEPPPIPPGIVEKEIFYSHNKIKRTERFIEGTEPADSEILVEENTRLRIMYPVNLSYIAINPDIAYENEVVYFRLNLEDASASLFFDGKLLGPAKTYTPWHPQPGRHILEVKGANNQSLDKITFFVKGTAKKPPKVLGPVYGRSTF